MLRKSQQPVKFDPGADLWERVRNGNVDSYDLDDNMRVLADRLPRPPSPDKSQSLRGTSQMLPYQMQQTLTWWTESGAVLPELGRSVSPVLPVPARSRPRSPPPPTPPLPPMPPAPRRHAVLQPIDPNIITMGIEIRDQEAQLVKQRRVIRTQQEQIYDLNHEVELQHRVITGLCDLQAEASRRAYDARA